MCFFNVSGCEKKCIFFVLKLICLLIGFHPHRSYCRENRWSFDCIMPFSLPFCDTHCDVTRFRGIEFGAFV